MVATANRHSAGKMESATDIVLRCLRLDCVGHKPSLNYGHEIVAEARIKQLALEC